MVIKFIALAALLAGGGLVLAGCSSQPADRSHICSEFTTLGQQVSTANGVADNDVFDTAGTLGDLAGRYQGAVGLSEDAARLKSIADSDSTSVLALIQATGDIATLCDQPQGLDTTGFGVGSGDGGQNDASGGTSGYGSASGSGSGNSGDSGDSGGTSSGGSDSDGGGSGPASTDPPGDASGGQVTDEASAQAALGQEVDGDRAAVEQLAGQWVPQLSSKTHGGVVDGVTYDYQQIWQDFQNTKQEYPEALLLWSGDYSSFTLADYWVTIVPEAAAAGATANAWCDSQSLAADQCYAKLISHDAGPKGSTLPR